MSRALKEKSGCKTRAARHYYFKSIEMNIKGLKEYKFNKTDWILIAVVSCFYVFGAVNFVKGGAKDLYIKLTPLVLLFSLLILGLYDKSPRTLKSLLFALSVAVSSFLVELAGVATGVVFGEYSYGSALGFKLGGTPLLIGINWIFLIYTSAAIMAPFKKHILNSVVLPSLLMVGYDLIMEQIAPEIDMWSWAGGSAPVQNYLAWGLLALIFHALRYILNIEFKNRMALFIFAIQFIFFFLIFVL